MTARNYVLIVERGKTGFGVYAPDLPGCVAVGRTRDQALERMQGAIALHLAGMREDGLAIPAPSSEVEYIAV